MAYMSTPLQATANWHAKQTVICMVRAIAWHSWLTSCIHSMLPTPHKQRQPWALAIFTALLPLMQERLGVEMLGLCPVKLTATRYAKACAEQQKQGAFRLSCLELTAQVSPDCLPPIAHAWLWKTIICMAYLLSV